MQNIRALFLNLRFSHVKVFNLKSYKSDSISFKLNLQEQFTGPRVLQFFGKLI